MFLYTIFSRKIANQLEKMGFDIVKMAPNRKNPNFIVYYFEDTIDFRKALRPLINNK